jgi:hypothetical protein
VPEDNPPIPLLPIWSTVTLTFIEARDDRFLNRQPGAKTESAHNSAHLTGLAWINSQERKPFCWLRQVADCLSSTHHLGFLPKA